MKAIVLCAGLGTRMRPLTDTTPKCMLPVGGKPLLHHTLERLAEAGVTDVAINLHHLPAAIVHDIKRGWQFGLRVTYSYEQELLGTAGAIKRLAWWLDEEPFFVVYGDEWTTLDFQKLYLDHCHIRTKLPALATVVVHKVDDTAGRNIVEFEPCRRIRSIGPKASMAAFHLKGWACSGIYVLDAALVWAILPLCADLETDVLPLFVQTCWAYLADADEVIDIGKPEGYAHACQLAGPSW